MEHDHMLFTAGQFAKLHKINKRTLHYYDEIGLFSPSYKGDNHYRYYTYLQSPTLEMILTLRELGMSIEEIMEYRKHPSSEAFLEIIERKTMEIEHGIKRLKNIKSTLHEKKEQLLLCNHLDFDKIEIVTCKEEYLLLSDAITGAFDDKDLAILLEHTHHLEELSLSKRSYGSMISMEKVKLLQFDEYDCFFSKLPKKAPHLFLKPAGTYLLTYCKGYWDNLPATYERILHYAKKHHLTLDGYAYEEGMNEIAIQDIENYITRIMISCKPS